MVTCSGSQPSRSTTMFLKSSKLSFWVSNLASSAKAHRGVSRSTVPALDWCPRGRPGLPAARAAFPTSNLLGGRLGVGRGRRHAQLGHDLDLVVHEVVPLHEAAVDLEDLDELALQLAPGRRDVAHRGLQRTRVSAAEGALDDDGVALGDELLVLDPCVRESLEPALVVFLRRLHALDLDAAWCRELDVRRGVTSHRLEVVRVEGLEASLHNGLGFLLRRGRDLEQLALGFARATAVLLERLQQLRGLGTKRLRGRFVLVDGDGDRLAAVLIDQEHARSVALMRGKRGKSGLLVFLDDLVEVALLVRASNYAYVHVSPP